MLRTITQITVLIFFLVQLQGCATTSESSGEASESGENTALTEHRGLNSSVPLYSHLRKFSGLMVSTSGGITQVRIRGVNTIAGNNSPLFVIDGARIGFSYSSASASVEVDEIDYINVLKGTDATQRYGGDGTNGVIEIFTKKG